MFALQSQIAGAKVVSQVVAKKQQRSTVANAKMAHGKGTLRQRNFVFERRTNHDHKTTPRRVFSLSRLDNSQATENFFSIFAFFPERSIVFFSFRFPRNSARALARALFHLSFSRVKESESARGSKKTKRGERRERALSPSINQKKISKFKVSKKCIGKKPLTQNSRLSSSYYFY